MSPSLNAELVAALKMAAAALRDAGIPFAVGGGVAAWVRGAPAVGADVDLMVRPADAERALAALEVCGMRTAHPPEGWLVKAWHHEVQVDVIFAPSGFDVDDEVLARCQELPVDGMPMPMLPVTELLVSKLCALTERYLPFDGLLPAVRALREQVDWERVRAATDHSPFARSFLVLAEDLGIVPQR